VTAPTAGPAWSAWSRQTVGGVDVRGAELPITSAEVRLRYNDVSTWTVSVPFTPQAWQQVGRGTRLELRRHRATTINGPVVDRELVVDADNPCGLINVTGESEEGQLADRVCFPRPALPFLAQPTPAADMPEAVLSYRQTAPGETVMKDLVRLNAGPDAITERRIIGLTVEPDQGRGLTYLTILRYDNLLSTLQVIGRDWGPLGFRVESTPTGRIFRVFTPPDLSGTVRFSLALNNLNGLKYRDSAPTATYAMSEGIVPEVRNDAGAVTLAAQRLRYAETTTDPASIEYGRRAETWTFAGENIAGIGDLQAPVRDALGAGTATTGLDLDPSPDYLLDADPALLLGARVTVQVGPLGYTDTVEVVDVVREVRLLYDLEDGTDTVVPTVGSDGATASILVPYLGGIDRRLSQLERR
jgi:hypothetical protein